MDWEASGRWLAGRPWLRRVLALACLPAVICVWSCERAFAAETPLSWSKPQSIDGSAVVKGVSCPSTSLCVAVDNHGNVLTSTEPTAGSSAWKSTNLTESAGFLSVSCPPSSSLCVAIDGAGNVWTSHEPTGGAGAWSSASLTVAGFGGGANVSCPSTALCIIAPDDETNLEASIVAWLYVATEPTGGSGAWTRTVGVDGFGHAVADVGCASVSFCVGGGAGGDVLVSETPAGAGGSWSHQNVDEENNIFAVSCPTTLLCAAGDISGNVVTSTNPVGIGTWQVAHVDGGNALFGISCPSASLCVAVDDQGNAITSTEPAAGPSAWAVTKIDEGLLNAVSCPSVALCVATDAGGNVLVATSSVQHTLTVTLSGTGSGTVTGNGGIACPGSCLRAYPSGTEITLNAVPAAGSSFAGWSGGGCAGTGACKVAMTADRAITATFLTRAAGGGGGGGLGGGGLGGGGLGGPGGPGPPTPRLLLGPTHAGSPVVFDGSTSSSNGSTITGYRLHISSASEEINCGRAAPIVHVNFAGPTAGTATLSVLTATGSTASAPVAYATTGPTLLKRARKGAAALPSKAAVVSARCTPAPGATPGSLTVGGKTIDPACEVHAGLVDAVGCGLHEVELCSDVPAAERSLLESHQDSYSGCLAGSQQVAAFASARTASAKSIERCAFHCVPTVDTYYLSSEPIRVNGLDIVPRPGTAIVIAAGGLFSTRFTTHHAAYLVATAAQVRLGNLPLEPEGQIDFAAGAGVSSVHIADFDIRHPLPFLPEFSDLPLTGTLSADLVPGGATQLSANVELPGVFTDEEGNGLTTSLALRTDNANGLYVNSFHLAIPNADLGEVAVENASLDYSREHATLEGKASVALPSGDTATAEIGFLRGNFNKFHFDYAFGPGEGIEVFDGIYLTELFGGLRLDPTELIGGSRVSIGPSVTDQGCGIVDVRGELTIHFGPTPFSIGGTGTNELLCQDVGTRYFHVDSDGHAEIGESVKFDIPSPDTGEEPPLAKVDGELKGQAYVDLKSRQFHFQFDGVEQASLNVFELSGDYSAELVVSDLGFGVCAELDGLFGSKWHPGFGEDFAKVDRGVLISPPPIALALLAKNIDLETDSCNIAQYRTLNGPASAARAGRARIAASSFSVPRGERTAIVALRGAGGSPQAILHGPAGQVIDATGTAPRITATSLVLHAPSEDLTQIQIRGRNAGAWTIEAAPGSPAITNVALSHELPPPSISAHVSGSGPRRVLHYRSRLAAGTRVTFLEQGSGGSTVIGSTTRAHGTIAFTPSLARTGRRNITAALVSADGTPQPSLTVTSYRAAPPRPGRPRRIRVRHTHSALRISFAPAPFATEHFVTVQLSDGRRLLFVLRGGRHSLSVLSVPRTVHVRRVRVRGEGFGVLGPSADA
jgi:hypothetical protein